ncbi:MAG TPA: aldehyde ferredoxin oxidoreductase N-terminal domain-containing protein [Candidatus Ozemobacteraceae bacterium]|nr:aldehyde ferredoxin oxidoreductase N-terminal domain-containing protein [Candidatus Ozemobacteraceae bacterium]HQG28162.1 aldehyde ferredoxin oxidoreductase N-terminal domain-containing protein [Candidatus Ozemobacteraceae bacterium]
MPKFRMMDVNLTDGTATVVDVTDRFEAWLGGTGVAMSLLAESDPAIDPFDPAAPIIFAIGPFSTVFPVCTKTVAVFKSPLTGNLGESHAGGRLAMAMFGAGIHVLRITGRAPNFSYLTINDEKAVVKQANSLRNTSSLAAERILRDREDTTHKKSIVRIGPAGERLSPIADVTVDSSRHFGRMGLGAVMGAKNLKGIVISGGHSWPIENLPAFNSFYKKLYDTVVKSTAMQKYHDLGTAMNVVPLSRINGLPTRNFSQGFFEGAANIAGEKFAEKHLSQQIACAHCQVGCIHMASLRELFDPEHYQYKSFKVSYDHELVYALGSNLSVQSTEEVLRLLIIIEKQGWDAISMGVTLAWAVDAYQKGIIGQKETDNLVLNFGDAATYEKVMARIISGHSEFYRDLERGSDFCARKYGGLDRSIAFGKVEAAGYMTGTYAFLGYATGVRHSHLDGAGYSIDQKGLAKPKSDEEQTKELYQEAVWRHVLNSLVICLFARNVYTKEIILEGLNALNITGWTEERLMTLARRSHALKFKYKMACGFRLEDVTLPEKLTRVMTSAGAVSEERYKAQLEAFQAMIAADIRELP